MKNRYSREPAKPLSVVLHTEGCSIVSSAVKFKDSFKPT